MFTVDLDDRQWLQCMCAQIPNAFTINKVGMDAGVVVNPRRACAVRVTVLGLCVCLCVCLLLNISLYT